MARLSKRRKTKQENWGRRVDPLVPAEIYLVEVCGITLAEFKAEGRLGCANDYDSLRGALEPLLERIHRSVIHAGKAPRAVRLREWKRQMQAAVAAEEYEEAARLRDLIRKAEK